MPEERIYGVRDADGKETLLDKKTYQDQYLKLAENNRISTTETPLQGQQHRPLGNKGEGLYMIVSAPETVPETIKVVESKPVEPVKSVEPVKAVENPNLMDKNFKVRDTVWNK